MELDNVDIIQNALTDYKGFTSGEKKYCNEHLSEWISNDNGFDKMIDELAEKSLDVKPFLRQIGLIQ